LHQAILKRISDALDVLKESRPKYYKVAERELEAIAETLEEML
jgi:hypothetical protein